jgi:hypothetical protein
MEVKAFMAERYFSAPRVPIEPRDIAAAVPHHIQNQSLRPARAIRNRAKFMPEAVDPDGQHGWLPLPWIKSLADDRQNVADQNVANRIGLELSTMGPIEDPACGQIGHRMKHANQVAMHRHDGAIDDEAWSALSGTVSLPFAVCEHKRAAVKVIDPRDNEVVEVVSLGGED